MTYAKSDLIFARRKRQMMMMIINGFCSMVEQRKVLSLFSNWDHCQRSSPSRISHMPQAESEFRLC